MVRSVWFTIFTLPFLVFFHSEPLPTFIEQSLSALLVILLFLVTAFVSYKHGIWVSPVFYLWSAWGASLFISVIFNDYSFSTAWKNYGFAWGLSGCMLFSAIQLVGVYGRDSLLTISAWGLAFAALFASILGGLQYYGVLASIYSWVPEPQARFVGVFSQANNNGVFSVLGGASLLYLFVNRKLNHLWSLFFIPIIAFSVVASGSRTAWLGAVLVSVVFGAYIVAARLRDQERVPVNVVLLPVFIAVLTTFSASFVDSRLYSLASEYVDIDRPLLGEVVGERLGREQPDVRRRIWASSASLTSNNVMLGVGPGNYGVRYYEQEVGEREASVVQGYLDNAHNLFLMVIVEFGLVGLVVLLGAIIVALYYLKIKDFSSHKAFVVAVLGVLFVHSMTEYPLWHFHFLVIFIGVLALIFPVRKVVDQAPRTVLFTGFAFFIVGGGVAFSYITSYANMVVMVQGGQSRDPQMDYVYLSILERDRFIGPYASLLKYQFFGLSDNPSESEIERANAMMDWKPKNIVVAQRAVISMVEGENSACSNVGDVSSYYLETIGYFDSFFSRHSDDNYIQQYKGCVIRP